MDETCDVDDDDDDDADNIIFTITAGIQSHSFCLKTHRRWAIPHDYSVDDYNRPIVFRVQNGFQKH